MDYQEKQKILKTKMSSDKLLRLNTSIRRFTLKAFREEFEDEMAIIKLNKDDNTEKKIREKIDYYLARNYDPSRILLVFPNDNYNFDEINKLINIHNTLAKEGIASCFDSMTMEEVLKYNEEGRKFVKEANEYLFEGESLSPMEKAMLAFRFVASHSYNEDKIDKMHSRNIISSFTGEYIVCAGYAQLYTALCKELGLICESHFVHSDGSQERAYNNHQTNIIYIDDPKYDVKGIFYCDPCWSARSLQRSAPQSLEYFMLPLSDIPNFRTEINLNEIGSQLKKLELGHILDETKPDNALFKLMEQIRKQEEDRLSTLHNARERNIKSEYKIEMSKLGKEKGLISQEEYNKKRRVIKEDTEFKLKMNDERLITELDSFQAKVLELINGNSGLTFEKIEKIAGVECEAEYDILHNYITSKSIISSTLTCVTPKSRYNKNNLDMYYANLDILKSSNWLSTYLREQYNSRMEYLKTPLTEDEINEFGLDFSKKDFSELSHLYEDKVDILHYDNKKVRENLSSVKETILKQVDETLNRGIHPSKIVCVLPCTNDFNVDDLKALTEIYQNLKDKEVRVCFSDIANDDFEIFLERFESIKKEIDLLPKVNGKTPQMEILNVIIKYFNDGTIIDDEHGWMMQYLASFSANTKSQSARIKAFEFITKVFGINTFKHNINLSDGETSGCIVEINDNNKTRYISYIPYNTSIQPNLAESVQPLSVELDELDSTFPTVAEAFCEISEINCNYKFYIDKHFDADGLSLIKSMVMKKLYARKDFQEGYLDRENVLKNVEEEMKAELAEKLKDIDKNFPEVKLMLEENGLTLDAIFNIEDLELVEKRLEKFLKGTEHMSDYKDNLIIKENSISYHIHKGELSPDYESDGYIKLQDVIEDVITNEYQKVIYNKKSEVLAKLIEDLNQAISKEKSNVMKGFVSSICDAEKFADRSDEPDMIRSFITKSKNNINTK